MFKFSLIISFFFVCFKWQRQTKESHWGFTQWKNNWTVSQVCFCKLLYIEISIYWGLGVNFLKTISSFNLNPFGRNNYKCFKQKECTWWNVVENDCLESWWEFNVATFLQPAWAVKFYTTFPGLFLPICKVKVIISCIRKITVTTPSLKTDKSDKPNCLYFVLITYHFPLTLPHLNFIKA